MRVLYTNAAQFPNKKDDLLLSIAGNSVDIIMITVNKENMGTSGRRLTTFKTQIWFELKYH